MEGTPSIAIGLGDYVGGRRRFGATGPTLHTRDHAVVFDGLDTHSSGNYNGDRWSQIVYPHASWEKALAAMADELRTLWGYRAHLQAMDLCAVGRCRRQ